MEHIYILFQQNKYQSGQLDTYLNITQNVGILVFIVIGFITFEFFYMEQGCGAGEALSANRQMHCQYRLSQVFILLPAPVLAGFTVFMYDISAVRYWDAVTQPVVLHLLLCCLLNVVLVSIIAVLLGAVLGSWLGRMGSYAILVAEGFLMLPIAKNLVNILPDITELDFGRLIDFFAITAPDTNWDPDSIYGLSIEACRWALALFWIAFLLILFLKRHFVRRRIKTKIVFSVLGVLSLAGFVGFAEMGTDSVVRLYDRTNGTAYGDSSYYNRNSETYQTAEAGFEIISYNLDVSVKRKLYVDAEISVTRNTGSDQYLFTLYRGYKVSSVTDEEGNRLDFTQDGFYLSVTYPLEEETGVICITYKGTGNRYYSNYQGIALPEYFPWYPQAGWKDMSWLSEAGSASEQVDDSEKKFVITLDTNLTVVSNLEETAEHVYEGTASGATLIGGASYRKGNRRCDVLGFSAEYSRIGCRCYRKCNHATG